MSLLQERTENLFDEQVQQWGLLKDNHTAFAHIYRRPVDIGEGLVFEVQFNPLRKGSSLAKIDAKSIAERPCFLCTPNRPIEQRNVPFCPASGNTYSILCNPFPIFQKHFTIVENQHVPQSFEGRLADMIELAEELPHYVIFFNGAQCGASAPDHFHFQAGNKAFMPFEKEFAALWDREIERGEQTPRSSIYPGAPYLLKATDKESLCNHFTNLWKNLSIMEGKAPSTNVLMWKEETGFRVGVFHRKKHRPNCFMAQDESNRMISPGAVDMGGVIICALEKDYKQISSTEIHAVFSEISF